MIKTYQHTPIEPIQAVQVPTKGDPDYADRHGEIVRWFLSKGYVGWDLRLFGDYRGICYRLNGWNTPVSPGGWIGFRERFFPMSEIQMQSYIEVDGQCGT